MAPDQDAHEVLIGGDGEQDFELEGEDVYVIDTMTYHTRFLKTWYVFTILKHTIWTHKALWHMMGRLLILSIVVAALTYTFFPDAEHLDVSKFREITNLLNIFVGLMLSFFLADSVKRWSSCVDAFVLLFNSIRTLSMQFLALGVDDDRMNLALRYCVLTSVILINDLKKMALKAEDHAGAEDAMWERLMSVQGTPEMKYFHLTRREYELLQHVRDVPGTMWVWVATLIGRMAADGDVPAMNTPIYGRILDLCQRAQDSLRRVRTAMFVRTPFTYVHTLATLVHVTNILFAVALGLTIGSSMEGIVHYAKSWWLEDAEKRNAADNLLSLPSDFFTTMIVESLKCIVAPTLYQAFFMLGCSVSCPFADPASAVPVHRMLTSLRLDLNDSDRLAKNPPLWEVPRFKK